MIDSQIFKEAFQHALDCISIAKTILHLFT